MTSSGVSVNPVMGENRQALISGTVGNAGAVQQSASRAERRAGRRNAPMPAGARAAATGAAAPSNVPGASSVMQRRSDTQTGIVNRDADQMNWDVVRGISFTQPPLGAMSSSDMPVSAGAQPDTGASPGSTLANLNALAPSEAPVDYPISDTLPEANYAFRVTRILRPGTRQFVRFVHQSLVGLPLFLNMSIPPKKGGMYGARRNEPQDFYVEAEHNTIVYAGDRNRHFGFGLQFLNYFLARKHNPQNPITPLDFLKQWHFDGIVLNEENSSDHFYAETGDQFNGGEKLVNVVYRGEYAEAANIWEPVRTKGGPTDSAGRTILYPGTALWLVLCRKDISERYVMTAHGDGKSFTPEERRQRSRPWQLVPWAHPRYQRPPARVMYSLDEEGNAVRGVAIRVGFVRHARGAQAFLKNKEAVHSDINASLSRLTLHVVVSPEVFY